MTEGGEAGNAVAPPPEMEAPVVIASSQLASLARGTAWLAYAGDGAVELKSVEGGATHRWTYDLVSRACGSALVALAAPR